MRPAPTVRAIASALMLAAAGLAPAAGTWCLGLGSLGPIRAGMPVDQVVRLADFSGLARKHAAGECWHLSYGRGSKGAEFQLMIIDSRVVRIEIVRESTLHTISGARIGSSENDLKLLYGDRLDVQPHKYDENGHTITWRSADGAQGMRFETSSGKVTAIQSGPWEHLHYVEGCS